MGRAHLPDLPLARPARQPDRLGRDQNGSAAATAGSASRRARPHAGADPPRAVPARLRSRLRGASVVLGARRRAADDRRRRAGRASASLTPISRQASSRQPTGRSGSVPRTPKATASSQARSPGRVERHAGGLTSSRPMCRVAAGSPASRRRCSVRRCWTASRSSGSRTSPGFRPTPHRTTNRGSTTAGSCCRSGGESSSGQSSTAMRSSTRRKTSAPSASASTVATHR